MNFAKLAMTLNFNPLSPKTLLKKLHDNYSSTFPSHLASCVPVHENLRKMWQRKLLFPVPVLALEGVRLFQFCVQKLLRGPSAPKFAYCPTPFPSPPGSRVPDVSSTHPRCGDTV